MGDGGGGRGGGRVHGGDCRLGFAGVNAEGLQGATVTAELLALPAMYAAWFRVKRERNS